jgi:hypothetical protein
MVVLVAVILTGVVLVAELVVGIVNSSRINRIIDSKFRHSSELGKKGPNWIVKEVQKIWLECNQDYKYSVEGIAVLFKYKLLSYQSVDLHMAQLVDSGNTKFIQFGLQLVRYFYIENASAYLDIQMTGRFL